MPREMTSKQRLLAAIHHQEADRVPVSPRIGAFLPQHYGHSGWLYDLKAAREFDFDPLIYLGSPYGNLIRSPLADVESLADVEVGLWNGCVTAVGPRAYPDRGEVSSWSSWPDCSCCLCWAAAFLVAVARLPPSPPSS